MNLTPNIPTPPVVPLAQNVSGMTGNPKSEMTLYLDPSPYPEVTGSNDPETVALLKEDYAGVSGELTAIAMYIYQNVSTHNDDEFANALLQIAIVEMTHLDMLGDAIEKLGGKPSFDDGHYYWSAANVDYTQPLKDMLQADIKAETTAITNYEKHAALIKNKSVRDLILRIIKDEKLHLKFFTEVLGKMK